MASVPAAPMQRRGAPSALRAFWKSYRQDWRAILGLGLLCFAILVAAFAPWIAPFDPREMGPDVLMTPGAAHPMGTDHLGRDLFSRVVWGTRISLLFAVGAAAISFVIGVLLGAIAGYFGGAIDAVFSRVVEVFLMIPMLILIILLASIFGASIHVAAFVVGIIIWPSNARIARAQVISLKQRAFVRAARAAGAGHARILFRHILPNGIQPVVVNATLQVGAAILYEASLSFLGLGDPNMPSWGQMLREAQAYIGSHWWYAVFPGTAIAFLVLSVTLVGDGINRVMNVAER